MHQPALDDAHTEVRLAVVVCRKGRSVAAAAWVWRCVVEWAGRSTVIRSSEHWLMRIYRCDVWRAEEGGSVAVAAWGWWCVVEWTGRSTDLSHQQALDDADTAGAALGGVGYFLATELVCVASVTGAAPTGYNGLRA
jgi:hypothetical protein